MALVRATPEQMLNIRQKLTLTSTTPKKQFTLSLYKNHRDVDAVFIPRSLNQVRDEKMTIPEKGIWCRLQGFAGEDRATPKLRPEQKAIVDRFMARVREDALYGGIVKSPTGTGKTVMGISIAYALNYRTLIVVPTDYLMKQWHDRIIEWTGLQSKDIGYVRQSTCDFLNKPFTVAMLHSLVKTGKYPEILHGYFGTVMIDEIHTIGAETFSRVAPLFDCKYRVGLSATPRRKDGMATVFLAHIGPIISTYDGFVATPKVRPILYNGYDTNENGMIWRGEFNYARYLNRLAKSLDRNKLIAKILAELHKREGRVLLLCDRLLMISTLKLLLETQHGIQKHEIGLFTSKTKQVDKKIILGTYGSAGLGADLQDITSLVLATPRVDIVQAVGRALRKGTPTIVDIIDGHSKTMVGWWYARKKFYVKLTTDIREPVCPQK